MRHIAFVGDLHVGSKAGLSPEPASEQQEKILEYWKDFIGHCISTGVDTIAFVGDLLQGQNLAERGAGLITADMNEQVDMAIEVLEIARGIPQRLFFLGSKYHSSINGMQPEQEICKRFGGKWMGAMRFLQVKGTDHIIAVAHESSQNLYQSGVLEKILTRLNSSSKVPRVSAAVVAHGHRFYMVRVREQICIQLPGWTMFVPWKPKLDTLARYLPDLGGVILHIGEGVQVEERLYPAPPSPVEQLAAI